MTATGGCAGGAPDPARDATGSGSPVHELRLPAPPLGGEGDLPDLSPVLRVMRIWTSGRPPAPRPRTETEERTPG
ncbi:hypothetical protein ABTX35_13870 [Streptomyces sp. NPDC096080]|uniref:hypothetical protein n=1 Tax=Streptomyces sp. NPDC096080 TaxID=3156693 RepID=UPI0033214471